MIVRDSIREDFKYLRPKSEEEIKQAYPEYDKKADDEYERMREELLKSSLIYSDTRSFPNKHMTLDLADEYHYHRWFVLFISNGKCMLRGPWYAVERKKSDFKSMPVSSLEDVAKVIDDHLEKHPLELKPEWR